MYWDYGMKLINFEKLVSNRYNNLLTVLVVLFIVSPVSSYIPRLFNVSVGQLVLLGVILIALRAVVEEQLAFYVCCAIACVSVVLDFISSTFFAADSAGADILTSLSFVIFAIFFCMAVMVLLKRIFTVKRITAQTIKGGISVYLMMGYVWSFLYIIIMRFDDNAFSVAFVDEYSFYKLLYFSFTTLTTLGYGDIVPRNRGTMMLSNLEAIVGQVYLAVFIARLVGLYIVQETRADADDEA